jgi:hypothetical protein
MRSEIRIYFEGDKSLKAGFDAFLAETKERAGVARCRLSIVATGGKPERDFAIARRKHPAAWNILRRDSEGPLLPNPLASEGDSIFWMVEAMESWFHADKDALEGHYKTGFRKTALKPNPNVEEISKRDLFEGLNAAAKDTLKGQYHKTKHAPALLQAIKPALVRKAAPNCERLFTAVLDKLR